MQRAHSICSGVRAAMRTTRGRGCATARWPDDAFPLRKRLRRLPQQATDRRRHYPFVHVEGDGVHEIPVGPVHAGTIEPGHFRFSVVGEKVLRLEERLGYMHKGIEKRFESMPLMEGARLAGARIGRFDRRLRLGVRAWRWKASPARTSPARALWLRALLLERERIANHLGDLGSLGNDAGFAFGLAQFSRLQEDWLRANQAMFGHRYLMDAIVPGGVARDLDRDAHAIASRVECARVAERGRGCCANIYDEHAGAAGSLHRRAAACDPSSRNASG